MAEEEEAAAAVAVGGLELGKWAAFVVRPDDPLRSSPVGVVSVSPWPLLPCLMLSHPHLCSRKLVFRSRLFLPWA